MGRDIDRLVEVRVYLNSTYTKRRSIWVPIDFTEEEIYRAVRKKFHKKPIHSYDVMDRIPDDPKKEGWWNHKPGDREEE